MVEMINTEERMLNFLRISLLNRNSMRIKHLSAIHHYLPKDFQSKNNKLIIFIHLINKDNTPIKIINIKMNIKSKNSLKYNNINNNSKRMHISSNLKIINKENNKHNKLKSMKLFHILLIMVTHRLLNSRSAYP